MSLVTRCPACATTFRVTPAQLSARGGRVRCGKCAGIFDGVTGLLTEEAIAALPVEPSPQMGLFDARETVNTREDETRTAAAGEAAQAVDAVPEPFAEPVPAGEAEMLPGRDAAATAVDDADAGVPVPAFLAPPRRKASFSLVWTVFSLLALAAFAAQAALHFRSELAVLLPKARPYLATACDMLGCEVRLPRRADLMSIESSDLQADTQRRGVIVLNALLRNRAPFAQEYPALELTLTDQGDHPVIRRVLRPQDYLQNRNAALAGGVAGGAEETVRVYLDTGNIAATGYQLFLFYPCPSRSGSPYWQLSYPSRCQDARN